MVQLPAQSAGAEPQSITPGGLSSIEEEADWDILGEEWLSDEPELESDWHRDQIDLLLRLMRWHDSA